VGLTYGRVKQLLARDIRSATLTFGTTSNESYHPTG
jgi:hypothetical protein